MTDKQMLELAQEEKRRYKREWYQQNKERMREYYKEYRKKNAARIKKNDTEYWSQKALKRMEKEKGAKTSC